MQIDKLVQLLESPMFVHLRLKLLDVEADYHAPLLKSIYGLLMCLPQGGAFTLLNDRLTTVCNLRDNLGISPVNPGGGAAGGGSSSTDDDNYSIVAKTGLSLEKLLDRFDEVSEQYREAIAYSQKQELEREQLSSRGTENSMMNIHGGVGGSNSGGASAPRWGLSSGGSSLSDHAASQAAAAAAAAAASASSSGSMMLPSTTTSGAAPNLGVTGSNGATQSTVGIGGSNADRGASRPGGGVGVGSSLRPYPAPR
jgi:Vacuolar protein 14 C-terminal Fig4p binding